jgi:hypothetical protein
MGVAESSIIGGDHSNVNGHVTQCNGSWNSSPISRNAAIALMLKHYCAPSGKGLGANIVLLEGTLRRWARRRGA